VCTAGGQWDNHHVALPSLDTRRLAFGSVAELYDRARPSYPAAAIDDVLNFGRIHTPATVLEVGAGTGKATRLLAERGLSVVALEPSAEMAALARRNCAEHPSVQIVHSDFERYRPSEPVAAVVSAQAWHWVDPRLRYVRAREALLPGGALAALWTLPLWDAVELRDELRAVYAQAAPDLAPGFPMHPASLRDDLTGVWRAEVAACDGLGDAQEHPHEWSRRYTAAEYTQLVSTHQDHILLEPAASRRLLAAVAQVIERAGGTIDMRWVTRVCLARRA
jgi:SAM-dependent methyltransferase